MKIVSGDLWKLGQPNSKVFKLQMLSTPLLLLFSLFCFVFCESKTEIQLQEFFNVAEPTPEENSEPMVYGYIMPRTIFSLSFYFRFSLWSRMGSNYWPILFLECYKNTRWNYLSSSKSSSSAFCLGRNCISLSLVDPTFRSTTRNMEKSRLLWSNRTCPRRLGTTRPSGCRQTSNN